MIACTRREIEPRHQRGVGGGSERAFAPSQDVDQWPLRVDHDFAVERIGGIDCFHLDQRRAPVVGTRHGAHGRCKRDVAPTVEKRALVRTRFTQAE